MADIQNAQIITLKGIKYLVVPQDTGRNPTLYYVAMTTVPPEIYDLVYEKFVEQLYK